MAVRHARCKVYVWLTGLLHKNKYWHTYQLQYITHFLTTNCQTYNTFTGSDLKYPHLL